MTEEEAKEPAEPSLREIVHQSVPANDINGQRMAAEIFGELPADSPYYDQAQVMERDNPEPKQPTPPALDAAVKRILAYRPPAKRRGRVVESSK